MSSNDDFFCTSDASIHSGNDVLDMTINFHMQGGNGFLTLKGLYSNNENKKTHVSLHKSFSYTDNDGEFLFRQANNGVLEVSDVDKDILREFIPDFYLTNTIPTHHVRIKNLRNRLWLFTTAPVPYFACAEY